ncbi:glycosyltransferase [Malaciobacter mytili]|uniref:glycosyltransferase n=1 Tax=Malaciobacter mytili TaxID=603050 RepID=UPI003BB02F69
MKKILFIITKSQNGGAQKWTKEQIEICNEYFECFLATDTNGWLPKNVYTQKTFLNTLIRKRFCLQYLLKLNKFISENQINLIIASSANAGIYARLIKLLNRKVKVVYVSHGWSSIYNGGKLGFLYTFIEKQLSKISESVLCVSKKDYNNAKNIIKINENKLKWITNKIYPINNSKNPKIKNGNIKILTVARLEYPKRVDLLIKATKNLDDMELHIIGDGSQRNYLESIKHKNVVFHGEIDAFDDFVSYDLFALISDSEGLPLSALEAMSTGLPLILSDVGGCFELINKNGVLVQNNIEEIKKAINTCILNQKEFSKKSLEFYDEMYNLGINKQVYIDYYKNIGV